MAEVVSLVSKQLDSIDALLDEVRDAKPEEVLIVYITSDGTVRTRSNGTFSRMRTIGALEILKHDLLQE
jgi:hypothetical protein